MKKLSYLFIILISFVMISCGGGSGGSSGAAGSGGNTNVTINLGQSTGFSSLAEIPNGVVAFRLIVSGSEMHTINRLFEIAGQDDLIVELIVPSGENRHFEVFAENACNTDLFKGDSFVDLLGVPVNVTVNMVSVSGGGATPNWTKVYVSEESNDRVWVIDMDTAAVEAVVNVGNDPRGIDITPDNSRVYVANRHGGTVSVINTSTNILVNTIEIEGNELVTKSDPYDVVVSPDGSRLYVAMKGDGWDGDGFGGVVVVNLPAETVLAQIPFTNEGSPEGIVVTPDGTRVYTSGRGPMHIVDTVNLTYLGTSGLAERELVVSPDGVWVYAEDNAVRTSDNAAFNIGDTSWERGITITPDGLTLFSTSEGGFVRVVGITPGNPPVATASTNMDFGSEYGAYGIDLTDEGDRGAVSFRGSDSVQFFNVNARSSYGSPIDLVFGVGEGTINGYDPKQLVISHSSSGVRCL